MDNGHSSEDIPSSEDGGVGLLRDGGGGNETPTSMSSSPSPIISNGLTGLNRGRSKVWNEFVITGDGTRVCYTLSFARIRINLIVELDDR